MTDYIVLLVVTGSLFPYFILPVLIFSGGEIVFSRPHLFLILQQGTFLIKYFIYLFLERGEGREKEKERNIRV